MRYLRNLSLILALIMFGSSLLFSQQTLTPAQQAPTLTPEQQDQFNAQKLTITDFNQILYGDAFPFSTRWIVSKGYDKIDEPDFLRTVGLEKEALDSQSHLGTKSLLTWGGAGLAAAGLAVILISSLSVAFDPNIENGSKMPDLPTMFLEIGIGTVAIVGGSVMLAIGVGESPNVTPYGRAADLADKYNAQLLIKITGKE